VRHYVEENLNGHEHYYGTPNVATFGFQQELGRNELNCLNYARCWRNSVLCALIETVLVVCWEEEEMWTVD
jgi:hypothetical protein